MEHSYPYIASLTREPFLFYEMRSTAKLIVEGISDQTDQIGVRQSGDAVGDEPDGQQDRQRPLAEVRIGNQHDAAHHA